MVWSAEDGSLVKDLGRVAPSVKPTYPAYNRGAWAPRGAVLAVPGKMHNDVVLYDKKADWAETGRLKDGHDSDVSIVAFSPNGLYCITVGMARGPRTCAAHRGSIWSKN